MGFWGFAEANLDRIEQERREVAATVAAPPKMRIVQTPLDGQSKELRRQEIREALDPAQAAGAAVQQVDPMELLRRNTPRAARPARRRELDGFDLLRKRFA
jgi:hypothetical protein